MTAGPTPASAGDGENVLVTSGDVTTISDAPSGGEPVAAGGSEIAVSLTFEPDVLNLAFVTGTGNVQILQIEVADLTGARATSAGEDVVVNAELTTLSGEVIRAGSGAATPVGTIAVAASLGEQGDLRLSFADVDGDLQLIETNVAALLESLKVGGDGTSAGADRSPAQPEL
jgi:hypothetical protein